MRRKIAGSVCSAIVIYISYSIPKYLELREMITQDRLLYSTIIGVFIAIGILIWAYWPSIKRILRSGNLISELEKGKFLIIEIQDPIEKDFSFPSLIRYLIFPLLLFIILWQAYYKIGGAKFDTQTIIFSSFFFIVSVWFLIDGLFLKPNYYKLKFIVNEDIDYIFNICRIIIVETMNGTKIKSKEPKFLKGRIIKSKINIMLKNRAYNAIEVTVRLSGNSGSQIIDTFMRLFRSYTKPFLKE